jgi:phosphoribosylanthranilate isomerase
LRIKICGITNSADAIAAALLGADAIGLNFYPQSLRFVGLATAQEIVGRLPPFVDPVALFVNERPEQTVLALKTLPAVRTIQWHGNDPKPTEIPGYRLIVTFGVCEPSDLAAINEYLQRCRATGALPGRAIMVDARVPGQYGGTGKTVPWHLLADNKRDVPLILAGGLTPDNVAEAIRIVQPWGVDVASGIERSPGVKDVSKMKRFIGNAREAFAKYLT